jgi:hypothetical protein
MTCDPVGGGRRGKSTPETPQIALQKSGESPASIRDCLIVDPLRITYDV